MRESKKESIINEKEATVKKNEEVKTIVWVFWIMLAIIGVSLLFAGIQSSVQGNNITRVLYFFYYGGRIILTHGFTKKTQKTPRAEIEVARKRAEDYKNRYGLSE